MEIEVDGLLVQTILDVGQRDREILHSWDVEGAFVQEIESHKLRFTSFEDYILLLNQNDDL